MGAIRLYGDTSGYLELAAPAVAPSSALTIPAGGFGKVLQVVQGTFNTTTVSSTSLSYVTTNTTVSITPTSSSSKVLIAVNSVLAHQHRNGASNGAIFRGTVSGTQITPEVTGIYTSDTDNAQVMYAGLSMSYLDTPNTTSPVTYTYGIRTETTDNPALFRWGVLTAMEIAA